MRAKLFITILTLTAILFCSCQTQPAGPEVPSYEKITSSEMENSAIDAGTVAGDYIYNVISFDSYTLLMKYHIPTGTASTVCQDPFCTHNTMTCPFAVASLSMASVGNVLYFTRCIDDQTYI